MPQGNSATQLPVGMRCEQRGAQVRTVAKRIAKFIKGAVLLQCNVNAAYGGKVTFETQIRVIN